MTVTTTSTTTTITTTTTTTATRLGENEIHIRESNEKDKIKFNINVVTPKFLQKVFQLKTLPEYLTAESDAEAIPIEKALLKQGETYVLNYFYNSGHKLNLNVASNRNASMRSETKKQGKWLG